MMKMKIQIFLVLLLTLLVTKMNSQEIVYDIHNVTLNECLNIEKELGGENIPRTHRYISTSGEAQPLKFQRPEKSAQPFFD